MTPDKVFEYALAQTLAWEGGYSDDPRDPGNWTGDRAGQGELRGTKFGVSARANPDLDIANLTLEDVVPLYRTRYWEVIRGDALPPALAVVAFDISVNHGPGRLSEWLREGPHDHVSISARRAEYYTTLTELWPTYGRGWLRRLTAVLKAAHALTVTREPAQS